jgi:predicted dehydrogenase
MLKVILLGCGRWGANHLRILCELRDSGLIGEVIVVDPAIKSANGADKLTASIQGLHADLVIIATPSELHAQQARELMAEGYHVLVEKPLGCCESEAAQVLATAHEYGRVVGVGLLLRFHPAVQMGKTMLTNGTIGRLEALRFVRRTTRNPPINGNVIESLGVHAIDLMCHFMAEAEPSASSVEGDKTDARIVLEFPHGIEAIIDVAWQASQERRTVTLVGSNASLRIDLDVHDRATLIVNGEESILPCESNQSPLEAEIRHFISAVESHNAGTALQPIPDHGAALRGVRWTARIIESMRIHQPH